jgi:hypothetical protein
MSTDEAAELLTGAWAVRVFQDREDPAVAWTDTYGSGVQGLVVYHPSGALSVQVVPDASSDLPYTAYFGTWEIGEATVADGVASGVALHRITASTMPELLDEGPERPFRVTVDRLLLGDDVTWRRSCDRL